jgi:hypothetical protein
VFCTVVADDPVDPPDGVRTAVVAATVTAWWVVDWLAAKAPTAQKLATVPTISDRLMRPARRYARCRSCVLERVCTESSLHAVTPTTLRRAHENALRTM